MITLLSPVIAPRRTAVDADGVFGAARLGWIAAFLFFGAFLVWAALVRLDAAAHAAGAITVAGNRQAVQYKDGGIVRAIHVHEGQRVRAGLRSRARRSRRTSARWPRKRSGSRPNAPA